MALKQYQDIEDTKIPKIPKVLSSRNVYFTMHFVDYSTTKGKNLYLNFKVFFPMAITLDDLYLAIKIDRNFSYLCRVFVLVKIMLIYAKILQLTEISRSLQSLIVKKSHIASWFNSWKTLQHGKTVS